MRVKSALVVASVAGALLASGAVTGTTLARWQDTATLPAVTIQSGSMGLSINGKSSDALALAALAPGRAATTAVTLRNASPGATPVTSSTRVNVRVAGAQMIDNAALGSNLTLQVGVADGCTSPDGPEGQLSGYTTGNLTTTPLEPGELVNVCITVKLPANASSTLAGQTGNMTITFTADQVRP